MSVNSIKPGGLFLPLHRLGSYSKLPKFVTVNCYKKYNSHNLKKKKNAHKHINICETQKPFLKFVTVLTKALKDLSTGKPLLKSIMWFQGFILLLSVCCRKNQKYGHLMCIFEVNNTRISHVTGRCNVLDRKHWRGPSCPLWKVMSISVMNCSARDLPRYYVNRPSISKLIFQLQSDKPRAVCKLGSFFNDTPPLSKQDLLLCAIALFWLHFSLSLLHHHLWSWN